MAEFKVFGPYDMSTTLLPNGRIINKVNINSFWEDCSDFVDGVGCYIFAFRTGGGLKPLYIGKTVKGFKAEIFQPHKLVKYNVALASQNKGTPVIFFVQLSTSPGRVNTKAIDEAETFLIQTALLANPKLLNDRKKKIEKWKIHGVIRSKQGKRSNAANSLRMCLNVTDGF